MNHTALNISWTLAFVTTEPFEAPISLHNIADGRSTYVGIWLEKNVISC
jgi:hypothetical protein